MKKGWAAAPWALVAAVSSLACEGPEVRRAQEVTSGVVATGLFDPFELALGPDGHLWVTERTAGRVTRVSPRHGRKSTALVLKDALITEGAQDGLLGMVLHPDLLLGQGADHVFIAYTYDADPRPEGVDRRVKIVRLTYDAAAGTLADPVEIIGRLPGSAAHNAGRLAIGPDLRLYYTIGDQGNNQHANHCKRIRAQDLPTAAEVAASDWTAYQGKVLRLALDGGIPHDNPVLGGVRSHVYSYGHLNPQGLTIGSDGAVYVTEHGPRTDDEINVIEAGKNYGWPRIAGHRDDQAYVYADWSASVGTPCKDLEYSEQTIPASVPRKKESSFDHPDLRAPAATFYTVPDTYRFHDPTCGDLQHLCWPTIAPSGVTVYNEHPDDPGEPGASLLVASLKEGALFRVRLGAGGAPVPRAVDVLFRTINRYRDVAVGPDGKTVYVLTDSRGQTLGPWGPTAGLSNPGSILMFRLTD
jgi:PQQ-dependent dehydrogenase (s-GDH family)